MSVQKCVSRAVRHTGESELRFEAPRAAATSVVQGALFGGRENPRPFAGRRGQIPTAQEVPVAEDHMGRRGDGVLLQGEVEECVERLLPQKQVSDAGRKTRSG